MTRQTHTATLAAAGLALAAAGAAAQNTCYPDILARIDTPAFARGVVLADDGSLAIVLHDTTLHRGEIGQEDVGLLFYDVANPFDPVLLAGFATYGTATDIALDEANHLAYLADGGAGHLRVIDYTDPAAPFEVAVFETPGDCLGVTVEGGLAVVADGHAGVHLVDVSDPVSPTLISTTDTAGLATSVLLDDAESVVYVADRLNGLLAIDITEPSLPIITAMVGMQGAAYDLSRNGDNLYIAQDGGGLALADLAIPTMPALADEYPTPGTARAVAIDNHGVPHVADLFAGAHRIDPIGNTIGGISHTVQPGTPAVGLAARDGVMYIAANHGGVLIANGRDCTLCPADFAPDFGTIDLADVVEFAVNFQGTSNFNQPGRAAALADPADVTDLADIVAFIEAFESGCP